MAPPEQSTGEENHSHPAGHALCHAPHGSIGLLGHKDTLLPHVSLGSTAGQPLANQDSIGLLGHQETLLPYGQLLAFLVTRKHTAAPRSACGQPLANQDSVGLLGYRDTDASWSTIGQPLATQDTIGLLGHQDTLLPHSQPVINRWPTRTPLAFLVTRTLCCLMVNRWPTSGQPRLHWPSWPPGNTAASWSACSQSLANQDTIGLLGHKDTLLPHGQPVVNHWPTRTQ